METHLIQKLLALSVEPILEQPDDLDVEELCGYNAGFADGRIAMAREILKALNITNNTPV